MNKLFLLTLTIVSTLTIKSQVYSYSNTQKFKTYKCEFGGFMGVAKNDYTFGAGIYLHPSYFISDNINIGFKGESSMAFRIDPDKLISGLTSYQLTSRFYPSTDDIRMYTELGTGLFIFNTSTPKEIRFGIIPKIGLDLGSFSLFLAYNIIFDPENIDRDHLSINFGYFLGGTKI